MQGITEQDANRLMMLFDRGATCNRRFVFHYTTKKAAKSILEMKCILASGRGFVGRGVYTATTPTPNRLLKMLPLFGFGLWNRPVRLPIDLHLIRERVAHQVFPALPADTELFRPIFPPKTLVIRLRGGRLPLSRSEHP